MLFESGTKHHKYNDSETVAKRWLAIREQIKSTCPVPFDFSGHNMILVNRAANDNPNTKKLEEELNSALQAMLKY